MRAPIRTTAALTLAGVVLFALFIAACGSDKTDLTETNARLDQIQASLDVAQTQATKGQMQAALTVLRVDDLHGLAENLGAATEIDTSWQGRATRMRRAVASVTWPDDMKDAAAVVLTNLTDLETALASDNLADASASATASHDSYHELDHMASPYLAGETPAPEEAH